MEGKALIWFQELKSTGGLTSWDGFLRALSIRFGKGPYDDPMETLSNLKQVGLLEEYKTQFDTLAIRVHDLPDFHKLSMFLGGLKEEIRLPVRVFNLKTLVDAYSLARIQEETILSNRKLSRTGWNSSQYPSSSFGGQQSLGGFSMNNTTMGTRITMPRPQKLSTQSQIPVGQSGKGSMG